MVSDFRCALELATRLDTGVELVTWEQGNEEQGTDSVSGQRNRTVRIAPHAYFAGRDNSMLRPYFLEVYRSTEEQDRLMRKFTGYWWCLQTADYQAAHVGHRAQEFYV